MKPAQQKIVIVGGSSGIGLAAAQRLDREGYRVVITARIEARIDEALRRIGGAVSGQADARLCAGELRRWATQNTVQFQEQQ
jgi:NAD(P)-dependent dehydrogenase (short-subunit alcohol dehydrogenase family)